MKYRLSLILMLSLGASVACGDDSDDGGNDLPDGGTETDATETETEGTDTEGTDTDGTDTDGTDTEGTDTDGTDTDGTDTDGTDTDVGDGGVGDASTPMDGSTDDFAITSPAFADGEQLPDEYTCEGKEFGDGISPELEWSGAPAETVTYAIVFKDLSLLDSEFPQRAYHWAAWNIPATVTSIPEALSAGQFPVELEGGEQFRAGPPHENEFFGPCPSLAHLCEGAPRSTDSYSFTLYAFDDEIAVPAQVGMNYVQELDPFFEDLAIAVAELNATSDASPASAVQFCPDLGDAGAGPATDSGVPESDAGEERDSGVEADASVDASTP